MVRNTPSCRWCSATALYRLAVIPANGRIGTSARSELSDRPRFCCAFHLASMVAGFAGSYVVILDPVFTAAELPGEDDDDTRPFPPIRETVLRRPPPPEVRELKGAELLLALAAEMKAEDLPQLDDDADEDRP